MMQQYEHSLQAPPARGRPPEQLDLESLVQRCRHENERFHQHLPHDRRFAYELFRRALVERDEPAWGHLYQLYSAQVERWVLRSSGFARTGESGEFLVGAAFVRFWRAVTPERFAGFETLGALLRYLRCCASGAVIDMGRTLSWSEMLPEEARDRELASPYVLDEEVLAGVAQAEFWLYVDAQLSGEAERVVLHCSFVLGMRPGEIQRRYPQLFASVDEVYSARRNALRRLRRRPELRERFT
jgi:hypothetical protein